MLPYSVTPDWITRRTSTSGTGDGPVLTSVTAAYLQRNLRPQLAAVAVVGLPLAADFGPVAVAEVGDRADQGKAFAGLGVAVPYTLSTWR